MCCCGAQLVAARNVMIHITVILQGLTTACYLAGNSVLLMFAIAISWSWAACAAPLRACVGHTLVSVFRKVDVAWDQAETACQQHLGLGASPQLRTSEELAAALMLSEAAEVGDDAG
jgi:hypothetical protein